MSITQAIYDRLQADSTLQELMAPSTINTTKRAIYEEWADPETPMPYLCLSFSLGNSEVHFAKSETLLNIDIFTQIDSITAERIARACIFSLDMQVLTDPDDGAFIRCYYNRDGQITEPTDGIIHWNIEMSLHHWRDSFIEHLNS